MAWFGHLRSYEPRVQICWDRTFKAIAALSMTANFGHPFVLAADVGSADKLDRTACEVISRRFATESLRPREAAKQQLLNRSKPLVYANVSVLTRPIAEAKNVLC
jgi:hypothetical protein